MLDNAVGRGASPRPHEQVFDIFQPSGGSIDEIFGFTTAIDPAADLHFGRVDVQNVARVVEGQSGFGEAGRFAAAGAVEDDVGHLFAAETLGALVAEDPFDGVDDVAFAAAVRSDDARDPGRELEHRSVGKALKAEQFEGLEHRGLNRRDVGPVQGIVSSQLRSSEISGGRG